MNKTNGLRGLIIIHKAMLIGQLIFAAICFYLVYTKSAPTGDMEDLDKILQVIAIVISVAGFLIGTSLFKKKLLKARSTEGGNAQKFDMYRSASIIQWALIEGPSLFCIIGFFLTGNYAFMALAATLMLLFTMMVPSKTKTAFQLGISEAELEEL
jgi:hypothetical protein